MIYSLLKLSLGTKSTLQPTKLILTLPTVSVWPQETINSVEVAYYKCDRKHIFSIPQTKFAIKGTLKDKLENVSHALTFIYFLYWLEVKSSQRLISLSKIRGICYS